MLGIRNFDLGAFLTIGFIVATKLAVAQEGRPAGLVMALSGTTNPPVVAMAEIAADRALHLAPGTRLTFLHYGLCKQVTVSGGTLSITRDKFAADGQIIDERDGPCPHTYLLGGSSAGIVMRGANELPRWPLNPEIVLVGSESDGLLQAAIYAEDKPDVPIVRLEVSDHRLRLPAGDERLGNGRYDLRLTFSDRAKPLDIPFIGTAPDGPELVIVLRRP